MVNKRNTLGRGLDSLLKKNEKEITNKIFEEIDIDNIELNTNQPRKNFNKENLDELSKSITNHGIIQPITVRRLNKNKYQLISGERRYRASIISGIKSIPAFIREAGNNALNNPRVGWKNKGEYTPHGRKQHYYIKSFCEFELNRTMREF